MKKREHKDHHEQKEPHVEESKQKNHYSPPRLGRVRTPDRVKLERLKTAAPMLPIRSTKPLTVPIEFNFSKRTNSQNVDIRSDPNNIASKDAASKMHVKEKWEVLQMDGPIIELLICVFRK